MPSADQHNLAVAPSQDGTFVESISEVCSMFDYVRNNSRVLFFVMLLLIIPSFVFFGVQGYSRFREGGEHRCLGGRAEITRPNWTLHIATRSNASARRSPNVDVKLLDTPAMKRQTLETLVREQVMRAAADKLNLVTSDERLQRLFLNDPQFAFLRNPDGSVNKDILSAQGMSSEAFAERLRSVFRCDRSLQGVAGRPRAEGGCRCGARCLLAAARNPAGEVRREGLPLQGQSERCRHRGLLQGPGTRVEIPVARAGSIEYLVLDLEAIKKGITVSEDDLRKYYDENAARYAVPEERRASHILVKADKSAPAAERDKAKAKARGTARRSQEEPCIVRRGGQEELG